MRPVCTTIGILHRSTPRPRVGNDAQVDEIEIRTEPVSHIEPDSLTCVIAYTIICARVRCNRVFTCLHG